MDLELILNILCGAIPLLYLIVYVAKQNKKKKNRNYLYGFIVAVVMALILIVIRLLVLTVLPINKEQGNDTTTTTKTTEVTTTETTTTKVVDPTYSRLDVPEGGTVLGKTSKGYEVKKINGKYYVDGYLIANKTYNLPQDYNPGGLLTKVQTAVNKMFAAAKAEKGFNLTNASGFRSYESQRSIYNNYVARDGKAEADTYSARPGYSEHQSGLALDICDSEYANKSICITNKFDDKEQAKWLNENAYKYGFILRYVKDKTNETGYIFESWHFRYVGVELAEKLYNNGNWITMEDYFGLTSSYDDKPIGE